MARGEKMTRFLLTALLLVVCLISSVQAQEPDSSADSVTINRAKFVFDDPTGRNIVTFESNAPLETILGRTTELYGYVDFNLDSLTDAPEAYFECDLTNLKTGIDLRDQDMVSEAYLAVDSFPTATLKMLSVRKTSVEQISNETMATVTARGEFYLHGVLDTVDLTIEITYFEGNEITEKRLPGDLLKIKANFDIRMSDYGIVIGDEAILKLDDRIHLKIDAFGGTGVEPIDRTVVSMPEGEPEETPTE